MLQSNFLVRYILECNFYKVFQRKESVMYKEFLYNTVV